VKKKGKTRAATTAGLFVMALLFCLLATASAQEEQPKTPAPQEQSQAVEGSPDTTKSTGPKAKSKDGPKTIGEMWENKLGSEDSEVAPETSGDPVPGTSKLNFPERKDRSEHWATEGRVGESTFFDKLIEVCWALAVISLLVWGVGKVAQRMGFKQLGLGGSSESMIEVLEKKRLSPGRTVMLMRVGPKVLAVAVTESGCETLTEIGAEEFNKFKDSKVTNSPSPEAGAALPPEGVTTPADIARHYLSIIPGTGAKK
jgi:flagellar biogenesis protein FliO